MKQSEAKFRGLQSGYFLKSGALDSEGDLRPVLSPEMEWWRTTRERAFAAIRAAEKEPGRKTWGVAAVCCLDAARAAEEAIGKGPSSVAFKDRADEFYARMDREEFAAKNARRPNVPLIVLAWVLLGSAIVCGAYGEWRACTVAWVGAFLLGAFERWRLTSKA